MKLEKEKKEEKNLRALGFVFLRIVEGEKVEETLLQERWFFCKKLIAGS